MHTIDLKNYGFRTDLVIEDITEDLGEEEVKSRRYENNGVIVEEMEISDSGSKKLNRKAGLYRTIIFQDITDKDQYKIVEDTFIEVFKKFLVDCNLKETDSALIVGLGNDHSTPDALGPKTLEQILVTRHLFQLGELEKGYRNTASFTPDVTGTTGIETGQLITSAINVVKPNFLIVIDALKANNMERVTKTIQMSNTGITPGSGVGNNREELSYESLGIPVIVIGVPTIVDLVTVVSNTVQYIYKHFSYKIDHIDSAKEKLIPSHKQNYIDYPDTLTKEEKAEILGMIGNLDDKDVKELIMEVLIPINYNLMVTPKEIDFTIDRLSMLLGQGINKSLHENFKATK